MKVALLGTGKTGGKVLELLGSDSVTVFNRSNPITLPELKKHEVIISFLPGPAFVENLELLLESQVPVVTGSTGFEWPEDFGKRLHAAQLSWIYATNFSLGMNLINQMIKIMSKGARLFDDWEFHMHEVHHIHKLDAPSGTALTWQKWLDKGVNITHAREGDVIGEHELTLKTPYENIKLSHSATDRKIFASGAIWAARKLLAHEMEPGLHNFTDITLKELL